MLTITELDAEIRSLQEKLKTAEDKKKVSLSLVETKEK